jgi:hypothetical protein
MREIRPPGSEGGGVELNRPFLPLSLERAPVRQMTLREAAPLLSVFICVHLWPFCSSSLKP